MTEKIHHTGSRSPEYALLGFLYDRPNYGYTLHQLLVSELGHIWHVSQSQTYNILKRLEAEGDVSATLQAQEKLPARQMLKLTASGRRRFEHWLETPSGSSVRAIRLEFLTRLYFAEKLFPERSAAILAGESADIDAALSRLEKDRASLPAEQSFNRLGLDLRIRQLASVKDWLVECRKVLHIKA
jgi:PadR family transcriptional regulator, regulatory protein AphA